MLTNNFFEIAETLEESAAQCGTLMAERLKEAIERSGRATLAVSGGSTPAKPFPILAQAKLDWSKVHVYFGDERAVPPTHADSNFKMARETLLDHVPIPAANVHRIRGEAWLQGPRSPLSRRIERLAALPEVQAALEEHPDSARLPILPISMKLGGKTLSFITTLTTFGSVQDALAQGVLIESFFPADDETKAHFEGA